APRPGLGPTEEPTGGTAGHCQCGNDRRSGTLCGTGEATARGHDVLLAVNGALVARVAVTGLPVRSCGPTLNGAALGRLFACSQSDTPDACDEVLGFLKHQY